MCRTIDYTPRQECSFIYFLWLSFWLYLLTATLRTYPHRNHSLGQYKSLMQELWWKIWEAQTQGSILQQCNKEDKYNPPLLRNLCRNLSKKLLSIANHYRDLEVSNLPVKTMQQKVHGVSVFEVMQIKQIWN